MEAGAVIDIHIKVLEEGEIISCTFKGEGDENVTAAEASYSDAVVDALEAIAVAAGGSAHFTRIKR